MHDTLEEINSCALFNRMLECSLSIPPCRSPGTRTIPLLRTRSVAPALSPRHPGTLPGWEGRLRCIHRPDASLFLPHTSLARARALALPGREGCLRLFRRHCRLVSGDGRLPGAPPSLSHTSSRALALAPAHDVPGREGQLICFPLPRRQVRGDGRRPSVL